jgi:exodeoxyribonuclease X
MTIRVIDIETTGVDPATDGIVEIASVDVYRSPEGHGITSEREFLVFPGREIPPEASAVHHIVDRDVAGARRIEEVIDGFKTADAYIAHNNRFERSFLDRYFGEQKWVCTFKCALRAWPDAPGHSNQVLRYWLGLLEPFGRNRDNLLAHRAKSDAIVTAAIFVELCKVAKWSEMLSWSNEAALFTRLNFGKHRGMKYADAPADYLEWLAFKSEMDEDVKFSAEHWLKRRGQPAEAAA